MNSFVFLLAFTACALLSGVRVFRLAGRMREMEEGPTGLLSWTEQPKSTIRYQPVVAMTIGLHTTAILVIALLALDSFFQPSLTTLPYLSSNLLMVLLAYFIQIGSAGLIGYLSATAIAYPLTRLRIQPVRVTILQEGVRHGRLWLGWENFSHFRVEQGGIVQIYSAATPGLAIVTIGPAEREIFAAAVQILENSLPTKAKLERVGLQRTPAMLPLFMVALSAAFIAASWLVHGSRSEYALAADAILIFFLLLLGGSLIQLYSGVSSEEEKAGQVNPS